MAVKFYLPDGARTDIVALSLPCFFVRTPEDFLVFTRRASPIRRPEPLEMPATGSARTPRRCPPSRPRSARTRRRATPPAVQLDPRVPLDRRRRRRRAACATAWSPRRASGRCRTEEAKAARPRLPAGGDRSAAAERVPRCVVIVAEEGDAVDDPTVAWPDERERVEVGRLELTGPETERERGDDVLVFDPMRVTDGIERRATTRSCTSGRGRTGVGRRGGRARPRRLRLGRAPGPARGSAGRSGGR